MRTGHGTTFFAAAALAFGWAGSACGGDSDMDLDRDAGQTADSGMEDASTDDGPMDASTEDAAVAPIAFTLRGTIHHADGSPRRGVTAYVRGSDPVVSDSEGKFVIDGVTAPYDLLLASADTHTAELYVGLVSPSPTVPFRGDVFHDVTISGELVAGPSSGFTPTTPTNGRTDYTFRSQNGIQRRRGDSMASPFEFSGSWTGPSAITQTLHVFQYEVAGDVADTFLGYGSIAVGLVADGSTDVGTVTMNTVPDRHISGTVSAAAGVTIGGIGTASELTDGTVYFPDSTETGPDFDQVVPGVPGATGTVMVQASTTTAAGDATTILVRRGLALPATGLAISLPALGVATPTAPAADGELRAGAELAFAPVEGAVHVLILSPSDPIAGGIVLRIVTTEDHAIVPDTAPFGVTLPSAASYRWVTVAFHGVASVDAFAADNVLYDFQSGRLDGTMTIAPPRTLVTPP